MEERMKSVDRDFELDKDISLLPASYVLAIFIAFVVFPSVWHEVHLQRMSFNTVFRMATLPVIYIFPLIISLRFSRYIKGALKGNLVSERVAKNCEDWIGKLLISVYFAIMLLVAWN
jgi:uncharacterized protein (DUF983 family)